MKKVMKDIFSKLIFNIQEILMNDLMNMDRSLPSLSQAKLISVLLYGSDAFDNKNL